MERAGMDLGTISKITGHKKIETIVQNYSLSLEVRKLVKLTMLGSLETCVKGCIKAVTLSMNP